MLPIHEIVVLCCFISYVYFDVYSLVYYLACHIRVTSIQPHANLHQADIVRQKRNSIAADRTGGDGP